MSDCVQKYHHYCYCCGKFEIKESLVGISDGVEKIYELYFSQKVIRNVPWAPNIL